MDDLFAMRVADRIGNLPQEFKAESDIELCSALGEVVIEPLGGRVELENDGRPEFALRRNECF